MGRRSFGGLMVSVARDVARAQRAAEADRRRNLRAQIHAQRIAERETVRARAMEEKEAKRIYIEEKNDEAEEMTRDVQDKITELKNILLHTLSINDVIGFDSLRIRDSFPEFSPTEDILNPIPPPLKSSYLAKVAQPSFLMKFIPGSQDRYNKAIASAERQYEEAMSEHRKKEENRLNELLRVRAKYETDKADYDEKTKKRNCEIDEFEADYRRGDSDAIVTYCTMVLERSEYPDGFPQQYRVAYVPESKEVVVDYELPSPNVIPTVAEYRYAKNKDRIEEKPRKESEIKNIYQDVVASVCLRTCHELLEADQNKSIDTIVFNGFVNTVDVSTGKDIRPFLISVRVTKERFLAIDLGRIDKKACLRNLGAQVSPRPYEVLPVKPIVEFDMVDKRFVDQSDILGDLESRPNLMDLNPFEFENLIGNLFKQIGLETKLTRSSRDGGVDVVAYDIRPVVGGKVVIQAKRYKNTVGVSAVRDLYGTMLNEGANKGILVTTSGYGPDAFEFASDKPIELLDGGRLLYLLEQVGVKARIIFPSEGNPMGT